MRFSATTIDIPDELIRAQEEGHVLIVAGAGISMPLGLPSFRTLVEGIYAELGEGWDRHVAEREVMRRGGSMVGQYDRAVRMLERRLGAHDSPRAGSLREKMRGAVENQLQIPPNADLTHHVALLELSKGTDGASRLLTTNFDCGFECGSKRLLNRTCRSHVGPALPRPGTQAFQGALHLHGRVMAKGLSLDPTDLVLTSAEFGDAYVRSGWASRYVYDLARSYTLVLVGYGADDPPMRYLLEVLEDDRRRYPDLRPVYAFAPDQPGGVAFQRAMWEAKGITPLIYATSRSRGHSQLYETISAWHQYASNPSGWRRSRLATITSKPCRAKDTGIGSEAAKILAQSTPDTIRALKPHPSWWKFAIHERSVPTDVLEAWVISRMDDPRMLQAVLEAPPSDPFSFDTVEIVAGHRQSGLDDVLSKAWRLMVKAVRLRRDEHRILTGWYRAEARLRAGQADLEDQSAAVMAVRPYMFVGPPSEFRRHRGRSPHRLASLVKVSFGTAGSPTYKDVLRAIPESLEQELALLRRLDREFGGALEEALDAGYLTPLDLASEDVPSIGADQHGDFRDGFAPLTRMIAGLWSRIADRDPLTARNIASAWSSGRFRAATAPSSLDDAQCRGVHGGGCVPDCKSVQRPGFLVARFRPRASGASCLTVERSR